MDSEGKPTFLNESQRRAVWASLHLMERTMQEIERLLASPATSLTSHLAEDLNADECRAIQTACIRVRTALGIACRRLNTETAARSRRAEVRGEVATLWAMLEDTKSPALRGYGPLSREASAVVDEALEEISKELQGILRVVAEPNPVRSGAGHPASKV